MSHDGDFDHEGVYWRRMRGITSQSPIIYKELYDDTDEDPYSFMNSEKKTFEYDVTIYNYPSTENILKKNNENANYMQYFKLPYGICEYMHCSNVVKKTIIIFSSYMF